MFLFFGFKFNETIKLAGDVVCVFSYLKNLTEDKPCIPCMLTFCVDFFLHFVQISTFISINGSISDYFPASFFMINN